MKHCPICDRDLEITEFLTDPRGLLGSQSICKRCQSKQRVAARIETKERLDNRPLHSENAAKKKCPSCRKYVYVEPGIKIGTCYACGVEYKVTITTGDGTQPDNAHGIRLKVANGVRRTRGKFSKHC